jgi:hypothetical protein
MAAAPMELSSRGISVAQPLDIEPIEFTCADTDDENHGNILESGGYGRQRMRQ